MKQLILCIALAAGAIFSYIGPVDFSQVYIFQHRPVELGSPGKYCLVNCAILKSYISIF